MQNQVGHKRKKMHQISIWDRVTRSAYVNCDDAEWLEVILEAERLNIIPAGKWAKDVIEFNARAELFGGTVREFLTIKPSEVS